MADPSGKQGQFSYQVNSGSAQSFSAAALSGGNIVLTTSGTPIAYGNTVTVSYTAGTVTAADGGVLASFSGQAVTNNIPAGSAPTFSSAATNTAGTTITLIFSKAMADPSGKQGQFSYQVNSGSAQSFSAAALSGGNIVLTTSGTPIAYGNTVTVSYTAGTVTAADGGVLASFSGQAVTNNIPAGSAPTFSSAATNTAGTTITLIFSKAMADPSGKQGQFSYQVNSGSAQSFSAAALSGGNIVLTTSGTPIAYGNTVTVSYTAGTVTAADGGVLASSRPGCHQ